MREKPLFRDLLNLDDRVLGLVAERYALPEADCFLPVLLDGDRCSLLEVRSDTSKKAMVEAAGERYFLKQIPWYCDSPEQIAVSTRIQEGLRRAGVPVARLRPTRDNRLWTSFGGESFVLFDCVEGLRYRKTPGQDAFAARTLAQLHRAAVMVDGAPAEDVFTLAADHIGLLRSVVPAAAGAASVLEELLAPAERQARSAGFDALPVTAVHGDFNPWNLLFTEDQQVAAVVDFDNCDVASRLHDVAEALLTFCVVRYADDTTNFAFNQARTVDRSAVDAFLTHYEEVWPLTPTERACLPPALGAVWIELTCLGLLRGDFTLDCLDRHVDIFRQLTRGPRTGEER
ncbi:phosphotransferase enzyme family protein [Streptomyces sp. NPDC059786]|uniref:phosphotransferase enzyme family protein n=1 Tax=Streptomyces sp. NPDC059786 TaxID=3346946 RepID=UPI00366328BA